MEKIIKYRTSDGKEFEDKKKAEAHEFAKKGKARVDKWLEQQKIELKEMDNGGYDNLDLVLLTILSDLKGFTAFVTKKDKKKVAATNTPIIPNNSPGLGKKNTPTVKK